MTQIEDLRGRMEKLFPMLGSENDGEVANAARAITRILRGSNLDWHDVVDKIFRASDFNATRNYKYYPYSEWAQSEQKKRKRQDKKENPVNWHQEKSGHFHAIVFGRSCTVFKSFSIDDTWDGIIYELGGQMIWIKNKESADIVKAEIVSRLDPAKNFF